ncbi:MAG: Na(+)-translocating NADH-quinone reductase subunit A [Desulfobacterales bacterium]|nr:Na(+)-translocating NADH-quinone reductase subunit A [Desulfobacterales bacterium]
MISLHVKKGYDLKIIGEPSREVEVLKKPDKVAVLPEKIPFIKPRLTIKVGDRIKVGSTLFEDKRNPDIKFLSPGGGEVTQINFGHRRVIKEIVIQLDSDEEYEEFESVSENLLEHIEQENLVKKIMKGGLWPLIRELPFRDIANPQNSPPAIFINLCNREPFQPDPEVYLKGKSDLFKYGIKILKKLTDNPIYIFASPDSSSILDRLNEYVTHVVYGKYPADDPGVFLYYTRKSSSDNRAWYISGQDVILLAHLFKNGRYPINRTVVLAGQSVDHRKHVQTRLGAPVAHIAKKHRSNGDLRYIAGGVFKGYTQTEESYLGLYETSLTLIPDGGEQEFFGFLRPGFSKSSYSRTFLSFFNNSELKMDCNLHGEERACINCGYCTNVCPVDILPQFTYKSILADEVEESLAHGLLDCVECGLCTYVCPSKIELRAAFIEAKKSYYKEL